MNYRYITYKPELLELYWPTSLPFGGPTLFVTAVYHEEIVI